MVDRYLQAIVAAAEDEKWLPQIRVVAGNTLFVGTPGSSERFREGAEYALAEEHYNTQRAAGKVRGKKSSEQTYREAVAHGNQVAAHLQSALGRDETGETLTLRDCQVWPASGGDGVKVSIVRIPLSAVDGWWPGAGELLKAPGQGGGWLFGFGVILPTEADI